MFAAKIKQLSLEEATVSKCNNYRYRYKYNFHYFRHKDEPVKYLQLVVLMRIGINFRGG